MRNPGEGFSGIQQLRIGAFQQRDIVGCPRGSAGQQLNKIQEGPFGAEQASGSALEHKEHLVWLLGDHRRPPPIQSAWMGRFAAVFH